MKVGIVGLQKVGKTTLFRAVTRGTAPVDEFGGSANIGVVAVPDARLDWLVEHYQPKKATPNSIEIIDGAAKIGGDSRDKFGSDFFADVRAVDALVHVVRLFPSLLGEPPSPVSDIRMLNDELILADLQSVETRLARVEKSLHGTKQGVTTPQTIERDLLVMLKDTLESGRMAQTLSLTPDQEKMLRGYDFMSMKPQIVAANIPESGLGEDASFLAELKTFCGEHSLPMIELCAKIESEIAELPEDEQRDYLEALGLESAAGDRLIAEVYKSLGLITFYTAGPPEVRAYSIPEGTHVIEAAGKIHTDLARGFIRAEVCHFADLEASGSWEDARRAGKIHLHTKEYVVEDGDVIYIRFKV